MMATVAHERGMQAHSGIPTAVASPALGLQTAVLILMGRTVKDLVTPEVAWQTVAAAGTPEVCCWALLQSVSYFAFKTESIVII